MQMLSIGLDGKITAIYSDSIADLLDDGDSIVSRASHVEPAQQGGWTADLAPVGGPTLGPFKFRQDALDAEVEWLRANVIGV